MVSLRTLHLGIGLGGLLAVVVTGQYMHIHLDDMQSIADGPRMMYRSAHIYLLWSSLLNLVVAAGHFPNGSAKVRWTQRAASFLLAVGPILTTLSFFTESEHGDLLRTMGRIAPILALIGVLMHVGMRWLGQAPDHADRVKVDPSQWAD